MSPAGRVLTPIHGLCTSMKLYPAPIRQNICSILLKPVLCSLIFMLLGTGFVVAAEIDDSSLFIEAFSAYQKKDYLLAIDKIGTINQLFPDTPLRDVALLLLARSGLKSGDNELAAASITRFNSEFAANPLKSGIEADLLRLGSRWQRGEKLLPTLPLRTAAQSVRNQQLALERSTAEKNGQGQLLAEKAEQDRITREKAGAGRREHDSLASGEMIEREAVRPSISMPGSVQTIAVGQRGEIPFEVVNRGSSSEDFTLETMSPPEYETMLTVAGHAAEKVSQVTIAGSASVKGGIMVRMPTDKIDGHKATVTLRAVSVNHPQLVQSSETHVITAAPLVRVVARPEKQKLALGEQTRYRVTVLNVGSIPALQMTVRITLPEQLEFQGGDQSSYLREAAGSIIFKVDALNTGKLAEFTMYVKVREDCPVGQELRSKIEVVNNQLQTEEIFTSAAAVVQTQ